MWGAQGCRSGGGSDGDAGELDAGRVGFTAEAPVLVPGAPGEEPTRLAPGEHFRVFPISNWTELDVWQYIERENIALPSLYYSHKRDVVDRRGLLVPVTELTPAKDGETVESRDVRFRTVGDITCTCPVESTAATPQQIVLETLTADVSERGSTRMDDKTSDASMEKRKKDGYF